jgi:hypothetical protein
VPINRTKFLKLIWVRSSQNNHSCTGKNSIFRVPSFSNREFFISNAYSRQEKDASHEICDITRTWLSILKLI